MTKVKFNRISYPELKKILLSSGQYEDADLLLKYGRQLYYFDYDSYNQLEQVFNYLSSNTINDGDLLISALSNFLKEIDPKFLELGYEHFKRDEHPVITSTKPNYIDPEYFKLNNCYLTFLRWLRIKLLDYYLAVKASELSNRDKVVFWIDSEIKKLMSVVSPILEANEHPEIFTDVGYLIFNGWHKKFKDDKKQESNYSFIVRVMIIDKLMLEVTKASILQFFREKKLMSISKIRPLSACTTKNKVEIYEDLKRLIKE